MSEFSLFGPGICNYFKVIKWCIWIFFILMVLSFVPMLLNASANDTSKGGFGDLYRTTVL